MIQQKLNSDIDILDNIDHNPKEICLYLNSFINSSLPNLISKIKNKFHVDETYYKYDLNTENQMLLQTQNENY